MWKNTVTVAPKMINKASLLQNNLFALHAKGNKICSWISFVLFDREEIDFRTN